MYELLGLFVFVGAISASSGMLDSLYLQLGINCSEANSFGCRNSRCIPRDKVCDGRNDCLDNSDEEECDAWHCTKAEYFRCKNTVCISKVFVCDGDNDCNDNSDEQNCKDLVQESCEKDEFMCSDRLCISKEFVCNGENDCLDGSDETLGCSSKIDCTTFKCKNGHCIPNEWQCDGTNDCQDNSDEMNCDTMVSPEECTIDRRKFLCANNRSCVPMEKVCDKKPDCPDKSDESPICASPTNNCHNHNCSYDCVMLPTGPKCVCPKGYQHRDEKTCVDIDECQTYGICDQMCRNTPGSYECSCGYRYSLQSDKKTCKLTSGEAVMYFSSKTEIRAYFLRSKKYIPIATGLKQVIGIGSEGFHLYWTDVYSEHESIFRANEDGSNMELLLTSGLGAPEDLALDWLTGNIYFTDSEYAHIGVCNNNAIECVVLINKDIRKPRGIALNPFDGIMYWTDWGKPAEIARAKMDGTDDIAFVSNDISWPNGLALDYHNNRLYWVDAKKKTIESVKLDGTGRMIVLDNIIKHPYAITVFEDRIYWSDWKSYSIQSCNKFTGKDHMTIVKEKKKAIYGIFIQHSAMRTTTRSPCAGSFCSNMCLLSGKDYKCVCPPHMKLSPDNHTCSSIEKKQMLVAGARDVLLSISHQSLGRHEISLLPSVVKDIGGITYDDYHHALYIYDLSNKNIIQLDLNSREPKVLNIKDPIGKLEDMAYDNMGNNLYWCDSERRTIEVLNLNTMAQKVIVHYMVNEIPHSIALIPTQGVMFVAFDSQGRNGMHIDRLTMDGQGRTHVIESGLKGPIKLAYDFDFNRVFFVDAATGKIETTSVEGDDRHEFKTIEASPSSITFLSKELFWTNHQSSKLYWADKYNNDNDVHKRITLDVPTDLEVLYIAAITPFPIPNHSCHINNGNCSHLCLLSAKSVTCSCPLGMNLKADGYTCYKPRVCSNDEFYCEVSDLCIPFKFKCNGRKDCIQGEDETDCPPPNTCSINEFKCGDGTCIDEQLVCDQHFDCADKSDEHGPGCTEKINVEKCPPNHHRCSDGHCLPVQFMCDGNSDCLDGSDEKNCAILTCSATQFRCKSGTCIPKHWECDHEYDCQDLSDEHFDCEPLTCAPNKFTCKNGKCIDTHLKCDEVDDCGDMSDETSCTNEPQCGPFEFPCSSNKTICVPFAARCNGTAECPHKEDEHGCANCHTDDFECDNRKCIPKQWLCDRTDDCGDNSDESTDVCSNKTTITEQYSFNIPCDHGYRCRSGKCIDLKLVCNGVEDCFDGSDEHGSCTTVCLDSNSNPCAFRCIPTPSGARCGCEVGYELNDDGKTCSDIKECSKDPPLCSQKCRELPGSFKCSCFEGFMLRADKMSCKSLGEPMSMYFTFGGEIRKLSQADKTLTQISAGNSPPITGMDVAINARYVYCAIEMAGTIHRFNMDTLKEEHIANVGKPQKIAIDWSTQNIYYYDSDSMDKSIKVCNMKSQSCAKVVSLDTHSHVSALAVDPVNKLIFYTLTHWFVFNSPSSAVYKCKLDGSKQEDVVKAAEGYLTGVAYDLNKKLLYYVDTNKGFLQMVNYDGSNKRLLISNLTRPVGLNLFEDSLYFLTNSGYMGKCKLYGEKRQCDVFKLNSISVEHFAIHQESRQLHVVNPCMVSKCSHICVPADVGVKCICQDGTFVAEGEACSTNERAAIGEDRRTRFHLHKDVDVNEQSEGSSGKGPLIAGILIPIFIVIIVGLGYMYITKKKTGNFNVSMRFVNPIYGLSRNSSSTSSPNTGIQPGEHEYCNPIDFGTEDLQSTTNSILQRLNPLVKLDDE